MNLSITKKITIWYTVFMLLITVGFLGVLIYTGNLRASETAKTKLMDSVADASEEVEQFGGDFVIDDDLDFYEDGVYISIYDSEGDLIEGRRPVELESLPELNDKNMERLKDYNGEVWYVYDSLFEVDNEFIWVRGIVKDFAEQSTFSFVMKLTALFFPILVILAALGGFLITRGAFKPVRNIIETVEKISDDGDLTRRVPEEKESASSRDEINKLAGTFNGMFNKLEASFEKEKQFTSDVSHELRTPLSVIITQSDYAKEDEEYREKALEVINKEARRMAGLVNRLLMLSRSDNGKLKANTECVDLSGICMMIAEQQESIAAAKDISIKREIADGIKIFADEAMLIRIILNLMENAIKYTEEEGYVKLILRTVPTGIEVAVEDSGVGIKEEDIEKIWERFYQVDSSRSEEGSGLGLSMVKALAKANKGKVRVISEFGKGSTFVVSFPSESLASK